LFRGISLGVKKESKKIGEEERGHRSFRLDTGGHKTSGRKDANGRVCSKISRDKRDKEGLERKKGKFGGSVKAQNSD